MRLRALPPQRSYTGRGGKMSSGVSYRWSNGWHARETGAEECDARNLNAVGWEGHCWDCTPAQWRT
jgi:hypothetical protein